jgi:hypothetical protein
MAQILIKISFFLKKISKIDRNLKKLQTGENSSKTGYSPFSHQKSFYPKTLTHYLVNWYQLK